MEPSKFISGVFIYLCMVQYSQEITIVSQKNKNAKLQTYCVSNNESETLSWITPYDKSYYYYLKSFNASYITNLVPNYWLFEYSFQSSLGPVLDTRWQNFETFVSKNNREETKSLKESLEYYFELTFSIKYNEDAEMTIYYNRYKKQTITFKNNILELQICPEKTILLYCKKYTNVTKNLQNIYYFSLYSWNHFTIRYYNNEYIMLLNGFRIVKETISNYGISTINMKSNKGAIWKLHIYDLYRTDLNEIIFLENIQTYDNNKLCMSGYFYFNHELNIQIRQDSTIIKELTFTNDKEGWKFIKIKENVQENTRYTFWLKYGHVYDVFFSHIKLNSDCDTDINLIYTEFDTKLINEFSCESLNNPSTFIRIGDNIPTIGSSCAADEFGNDCIKCKSVFNTDFCEETLTCAETNKCYCQPGYYGKHCNSKCDRKNNNVFGSQCNENCGHCKYKVQCHHITGECPNKCEKYFVEPFCNETDLPYLKEAPVVVAPCFTTCKIKFNPEMYMGRKRPDSYKMEVRETRSGKVIYNENIHEKDISLDKLNILTDYNLKIVLCHSNECIEGELVPILRFKTDCKDLERGDVFENIESRNIFVESKKSEDLDKCPIKLYTIKIFDERNKELKYLKPNSKYMIKFLKDNNTIFYYYVTTDQEKPGKIWGESKKSYLNSIYLSWISPDESVGKIVNYSITYRLQPTEDCMESLKHLTDPQTVYVETKFVEINNLRPHSTYLFDVQAFNKYPGEVQRIVQKTNSKDIPNQASFEIDNINLTSQTMSIYLKKNCERIESDVFFQLNLQCFDRWCRNVTRRYQNDQNILFIENLQPFTNYTILIEMATKFAFYSTVSMQPKYVTTDPSVSNELRDLEVYSFSDSKISLVFDLPYPPTGILEEIRINNQKIAWENCTIWKNRFCSTLNTTKCDILMVELKNMNVPNINSYNSFVDCRRSEPEPPKNLQQRWDEDFNLILSWEHPLHMNGEFEKFIITYADKNMDYITQENLTYTHKMSEDEICTSNNKMVKLKISTKNKKNNTNGSEIRIKCPVAKPKLASEPKITQPSNHSLEIVIPKFVNPTENSYIHIVVTYIETVVQENLCNPKLLNDSLKNGWIAVELTNNFEEKSIVIGNNTEENSYSQYLQCYYANQLYNNSALYEINIILTNIDNDGNETRRTGYLIQSEKVEDLRGIWDENMVLTLGWRQFKDKRVYEISYDGKDVPFVETKENHYQVHSTLICPEKKEFAQLAVRTKIYGIVSEWSRLKVACPPEAPTFGNNPIIAIPTDSCNFKLLLPPFQNPTNRSYISIFVEQSNYKGIKDDCNPNKLGLKTTFVLRSIHLAVHMKLTEPYDMLTIDIGEAPTKRLFSKLLNCSYQNDLLSETEKSIFYVIMTSADDQLTVKRSTLYVVPVASINDFRTSSMAV